MAARLILKQYTTCALCYSHTSAKCSQNLHPHCSMAQAWLTPSCCAITGEPRDMQDPANAPFMNSISRGECPRELEPGERRSLAAKLL